MKIGWSWFKRRFWDLRNGHSMGLALLLSFINFIVLNYNLLVNNIASLRNLFPHLWMFALLFVWTYPPLCIAIGYYFRKKQLGTDQEVALKESPYIQDIAKVLTLIGKKLDEPEIVDTMKKWLKN